MWVGARTARGVRSDPTTTPGRVVQVLAASLHHVVGVVAVAVLALLALTAVRYYLL